MKKLEPDKLFGNFANNKLNEGLYPRLRYLILTHVIDGWPGIGCLSNE